MKRFLRIGVFCSAVAWAGCIPLQSGGPYGLSRALQLVDEGTRRLNQGELEEAAAAFQTSLEIHETPAAVDGLGCVAILAGNFERAEALLIEAYQMPGEYQNSLGNLAFLYELAGDNEAAAVLHERAVQENPENHKFRNNLAAFLYGNRRSPFRARLELLKARTLVADPVIEGNLGKTIEE